MRSKFMKENNVCVFKTNIENNEKLHLLKPLFDNHQAIIQWTVDFEDIDRVLRVETSRTFDEKKIIKQMTKIGIGCKVMTW